MTEHPTQPQPAQAWPPPPPALAAPGTAGAVAAWQQPGPLAQVAGGPVGKVRSTGTCILLTIVTLGIYPLVWYYQTHEEMKRHTGEGLGGGLALVIALFFGIVLSFLTPAEVGRLYERRGQQAPVSAVTGLWTLLGTIIVIGPIVWFVKTNGALNAYWRSVGALG